MSKIAKAVYKEDMVGWSIGAFKNPIVEVSMVMMKDGYTCCIEDSEYLYFTKKEVLNVDRIDVDYTLETVCEEDIIPEPNIKDMTKMQLDNITVEGHIGTWYVLDNGILLGKQYFLLESEVYGDEAPCLIVDNTMKVVVDNVYNGWDDLRDHLDM